MVVMLRRQGLEESVLRAIEADDLEEVMRLADQGAFWLGTAGDVGALHVTAGVDAAGVALWLIEGGADADAGDGDGFTPLHWASAMGSRTVLGLLLAAGADPNAPSACGLTPLHLAADAATVGQLVEAGATVDARDKDGASPLHVAADLAVARAILQAGADPDLSGRWGLGGDVSSLEWAVYRGDVEWARLLLESGADPNLLDHSAVGMLLREGICYLLPISDRMRREQEILSAILEHGGDSRQMVDVRRIRGAGTQMRHAVEGLALHTGIRMSSDFQLLDEEVTLVHRVAFEGRVDLLRLLLRSREDGNVQSSSGLTPLHWAVLGRRIDAVDFLLVAGADPAIEGRGCTPFELAEMVGAARAADRLRGLNQSAHREE